MLAKAKKVISHTRLRGLIQGSRYRCSALQNPRDEAQRCSVEGQLLAALGRLGADVQGVVRAARTDRGRPGVGETLKQKRTDAL